MVQSILGASCTPETLKLLKKLVNSKTLTNFSKEIRIDLNNNTSLIRLALINFIENLPTKEEIKKYRAAIRNIYEFDYYLIELENESK